MAASGLLGVIKERTAAPDSGLIAAKSVKVCGNGGTGLWQAPGGAHFAVVDGRGGAHAG